MHTLVVSVVVRTAEGVLLVREGKENVQGTWDFPGGRVEEHEEPVEAAVREVNEELDVDVDLVGLVGVYLGEEAFVDGPFLSVAYLGHLSGEPRVVPTDTVDAFEWVDEQRLDEFDLRSSYIPRAIADASERTFPKDVIQSVRESKTT